jgi:hypothetical protein
MGGVLDRYHWSLLFPAKFRFRPQLFNNLPGPLTTQSEMALEINYIRYTCARTVVVKLGYYRNCLKIVTSQDQARMYQKRCLKISKFPRHSIQYCIWSFPPPPTFPGTWMRKWEHTAFIFQLYLHVSLHTLSEAISISLSIQWCNTASWLKVRALGWAQ